MSKTTVNPLTSIPHVPLFVACSKKEIKLIANAVAEASFAPGLTLIEQGQPGREAFIVRKGIVSVRRDDRKIASLGAGAIICHARSMAWYCLL
jgi:signal-transduction protein with cAMP-binding, CBS, and nucleotidyltransferase domain